MILLYWEIGNKILINQKKEGWGAKVIDRLSADLKREFPDMKGFSTRNLEYMRRFAGIYVKKAIVQQLVAQLPWGHNVILMDSLSSKKERLWYIVQSQRDLEFRQVL